MQSSTWHIGDISVVRSLLVAWTVRDSHADSGKEQMYVSVQNTTDLCYPVNTTQGVKAHCLKLTIRSVAGQVGARLPEDQVLAGLADPEWLEILASQWSCLIRPGRRTSPCLFHQGSQCYLLEEPVSSSAAAVLRDVVPAWLWFRTSASRTDG